MTNPDDGTAPKPVRIVVKSTYVLDLPDEKAVKEYLEVHFSTFTENPPTPDALEDFSTDYRHITSVELPVDTLEKAIKLIKYDLDEGLLSVDDYDFENVNDYSIRIER